VTRIDGVVVFVPFVLPGEDVEIEITEVKRNFARARLVSLLKTSLHRTVPQCPHFGDCGGCQYQHIDYPTQIELKRKQVVDVIERIGGFPGAIVGPVVPCGTPYGYRNRIMIRSQWDKTKQGLNIGFIRHDNRLVVDIEGCSIAEPALNAEIRRVRSNPPPKGGLKVVLRVPPEGWEVPRDSFFQNNFFLLPALVEHVRGLIRSGGARHLIDTYCGVGFFAVELADLVDSFAGIEIDQMAVQAAKQNAGRHGRTNGEFIGGNVSEHLPNLLARWSSSATAVVIDPPRTGCSIETIELLRAQRPAQIIYVSCHPATLARDLNALCRERVYQLMNVTPFDMFPQTQHIECVADLRAGLRG
jgi:tRNA/tmRNA/rRNA uracil-C5-methylase (TrmA/RlmC/RlmD family)